MRGSVASGVVLAISAASASNLWIDGSATSAAPISISSSNQTLSVGATGSLTIDAAQSVTNGHIVLHGGTLTDTSGLTIGAGATLSGYGTIGSGTTVDGTGSVTASGGVLEFKGAVDTSAMTAFDIADVAGSELKFDGAVGTGLNAPTITFDGTHSGHGILDLSGEATPSSFNGQLANFAAGDQILVSGSAGDQVRLVGANTLEIYNGATVLETLHLVGDYSGYTSADFSLSNNGSVDTITTDAICFYAGTLVRTPSGEVAVETLKAGDLVLTTDGMAKPVRWLGRQTISTVFADPLRVWPIRIKAGALGDNVPSRDLRLSPDHAVLVDGALVQAGALVNDTSIVRDTVVPRVFVYYHVELDDHSLILAENTPAETFIDNADRLAFDNWQEHEALYPDGKRIEELPYPRAKARRQVPVQMRVRLAERAQMIGATADVVAA